MQKMFSTVAAVTGNDQLRYSERRDVSASPDYTKLDRVHKEIQYIHDEEWAA